MMAELLKIHPDNPPIKHIQRVVECLRDGGVIIYPTDTVYGFGCDLQNPKAIERLCRLRGEDPKKMYLSFICYDLSDISLYAKITTPMFKLMKKALPGAFTFIVPSSTKVPKIMGFKKQESGIRVPDHNVPRMIVQELGNPIVTTSVKVERKDGKMEYMIHPELMKEEFEHSVDIVIDSGVGADIPSTVVNCIDEEFNLIRQGAGDFSQYVELV
ncbi:MAG: threonylcarbamoyl-AMP synthase [Bernardetiaceae bacterium]|nr:threonylcarbamoyl-AMP synthase [Bernardetiaceae bacterium]